MDSNKDATLNENGFRECRKLILQTLEDHTRWIEENRNQMQNNAIQIAVLVVKSGLTGFIAGLLPAIAAILYVLLKK